MSMETRFYFPTPDPLELAKEERRAWALSDKYLESAIAPATTVTQAQLQLAMSRYYSSQAAELGRQLMVLRREERLLALAAMRGIGVN